MDTLGPAFGLALLVLVGGTLRGHVALLKERALGLIEGGRLSAFAAIGIPALAIVVGLSLRVGEGVAGALRGTLAFAMGAVAAVGAALLSERAPETDLGIAWEHAAARTAFAAAMPLLAVAVAAFPPTHPSFVSLGAAVAGGAAVAVSMRAGRSEMTFEAHAPASAASLATWTTLRAAAGVVVFAAWIERHPTAMLAPQLAAGAPLLLEAFALVASASGRMAMLADEERDVDRALVIGATLAAGLHVLALCTALSWLFPSDSRALVAIALTGVVAGEAIAFGVAPLSAERPKLLLRALALSVVISALLGAGLAASSLPWSSSALAFIVFLSGATGRSSLRASLAVEGSNLPPLERAQRTARRLSPALAFATMLAATIALTSSVGAPSLAGAIGATPVSAVCWLALVATFSWWLPAPGDEGALELRRGVVALSSLLWPTIAAIAAHALGATLASAFAGATAATLASVSLAGAIARARIEDKREGGLFGVDEGSDAARRARRVEEGAAVLADLAAAACAALLMCVPLLT